MGKAPCRVTSSTRLARRSCRRARGDGSGSPGRRGPVAPCARRLQVGGRTVGNRLAIQPMEGCDGTLDGTPGELTLRRYDASAPAAQADLGRGRRRRPRGPGQPAAARDRRGHDRSGLEKLLSICRAGSPSGLRRDDRPPRRPAADPLGPLLVHRPILAQHDPLARPADRRRQGHRRRP